MNKVRTISIINICQNLSDLNNLLLTNLAQSIESESEHETFLRIYSCISITDNNLKNEISDKFKGHVEFITISSGQKSINGKRTIENLAGLYNYVIGDLKKEEDVNKHKNNWIILDNVKCNKNPYEFFTALEQMTDMLGFNVWFNTHTDPKNFIFNKWADYISINIDEDNLKQIYDKTIRYFNSANFNVIHIDDLDKLEFDPFTEDFAISDFWNLVFLLKLAMSNKGFAHLYPSIDEEKGVFSVLVTQNQLIDINQRTLKFFSGKDLTPEIVATEQTMFRDVYLKNINGMQTNVENIMLYMIANLTKKQQLSA